MQILGIIPSRFASTRFPGKPLVDIEGKTMIQRVYLQAKKATLLSKIVVATDDLRIYENVLSFGGQVMMTNDDHQSGTDRCAEVARQFQDMEAIINIQGDEPFIDPSQIDQVALQLKQNSDLNLATLAKKITQSAQIFSPNIVKVVFSKAKRALYFSRNPLPFLRGVPSEDWLASGNFYKHIGIYGYR
ncbi:MAG: 3-deoxy-manno-octulosonate cytidylyltransferase, partial [Bacteroidota bacterium]